MALHEHPHHGHDHHHATTQSFGTASLAHRVGSLRCDFSAAIGGKADLVGYPTACLEFTPKKPPATRGFFLFALLLRLRAISSTRVFVSGRSSLTEHDE